MKGSEKHQKLVKNPRLSTKGGGGFKKWLKFVHVVYGQPLKF